MKSGGPGLSDKIIDHYKGFHDALMGDWKLPIAHQVEDGIIRGRLNIELSANLNDLGEDQAKCLIRLGIQQSLYAALMGFTPGEKIN